MANVSEFTACNGGPPPQSAHIPRTRHPKICRRLFQSSGTLRESKEGKELCGGKNCRIDQKYISFDSMSTLRMHYVALDTELSEQERQPKVGVARQPAT